MTGTEQVPRPLVEAALRAAAAAGTPVAQVPLTAVAAAAGVSRSTVVRRLGGSRRALDEAVRRAGIDPGGAVPVRERAVDVAAALIARDGLGALTLDRVADGAGCAVMSLREAIGGRDDLLTRVFERHGPLDAVTAALDSNRGGGLAGTVRSVLAAIAEVLTREPQVVPALVADALGRPDGPAARLMARQLPTVLAAFAPWLDAEVAAGRIRPWPLPLLVQLLVAPTALHLMSRRSLPDAVVAGLPGVDEVLTINTEAFLRAVSTAEVRR